MGVLASAGPRRLGRVAATPRGADAPRRGAATAAGPQLGDAATRRRGAATAESQRDSHRPRRSEEEDAPVEVDDEISERYQKEVLVERTTGKHVRRADTSSRTSRGAAAAATRIVRAAPTRP